MAKRTKRVLAVSAVVLAVFAGGGVWACAEFFADPEQLGDELYSIKSTGPFSNADYAAELKAHVDDNGMVYYAGLKKDHARLDRYLRALAGVKPKDFDAWDEPTRIAFLVNAYNAMTLKAIAGNYPIQAGFFASLRYPANSIRQISGVWDKLQFEVVGRKTTLEETEHKTLRGKYNEPRIHMALVCAAMSCPRLRNEPYDGARLDEQLDDQARKFLANPAKLQIDRAGGKVYLSSIFEWFGKDFVKSYAPAGGFTGSDEEKAALHFVSKYVSQADAKYLRAGKYSVKYLKYDWSLNERKSAIKRAGPAAPDAWKGSRHRGQ